MAKHEPYSMIRQNQYIHFDKLLNRLNMQ